MCGFYIILRNNVLISINLEKKPVVLSSVFNFYLTAIDKSTAVIVHRQLAVVKGTV